MWQIERKDSPGTAAFESDGEPERYRTKKEAKDALREFVDDCEYAVARGFMSDHEPASDFRIVRVSHA